MHSVAALLDALLPELHEVSQGEQGVVADGDPVLRRPGFHGYQDDAGVELFLVDLKKGLTRKDYATGEDLIHYCGIVLISLVNKYSA